MMSRRSQVLVASILAIVLLAVPDTAQGASAAAVQPAVQPAVGQPSVGQPSVGQPSVGELPPDISVLTTSAKLTLNPAAHTVVASFGRSRGRRMATLQQVDGIVEEGMASPWVKAVVRQRLDSAGRATFKIDVDEDASYRVVLSSSGSRGPLHSLPFTLADQWVSDFSDDFDGDRLGKEWSDRRVGDPVPNRLCSVPSAKAAVAEGGEFSARIIRHTDDAFFTKVAANASRLAEARLKIDLAAARRLSTKHKRKVAKDLAKFQYRNTFNCPHGAFENAMVSTEKTKNNEPGFRVNTAQPGIVAARVKFPPAQGMHTGIWLQSTVRGGGEIDIAETFGYGYGSGLGNYMYVPSTGKMYRPGKPNALKKNGSQVLKSKTKSKKWWNAYHEVSIEWTSTRFVFRTDGTVTNSIKLKPGNADYFLILSLLSSDWELRRLVHPIGNGEPVTDLSDEKFTLDWVKVWSKQS